jgi:hypothetical protein
MTTITTEPVTNRSSLRSARQSILGFVAGLALAGALAVGINVTSSSSVTSVKLPSPATTIAFQPSSDGGCLVVNGPC